MHRKLVDITLEEAVEVMKLGEGYHASASYQLRRKTNVQELDFAQLYYEYEGEEHISANFSDSPNAVSLCHGNTYYRTMYRVVEYLESRGFDLASADGQR